MKISLIGKNALVCGASQGIGKACAIEIARRGASVTVVARDEAALKNVVASLDTSGGQEHGFLVVDFDRPDDLEKRIGCHVMENGPVHILVNNTGGPASGPLTEATPEALLTGLSRHVLCFQRIVHAVIPGMKEAGFGRIVNIISTSVIQPIKGLGVSNTVRGAVANWGRTLAGELARPETGRTVYLLDEPTTGLHFEDVRRLVDVLHKLVERGNTVIVIEHNLDVIAGAGHVIDLGPEGGDAGGAVVAAGAPAEVARIEASHTGQCLKAYLARARSEGVQVG